MRPTAARIAATAVAIELTMVQVSAVVVVFSIPYDFFGFSDDPGAGWFVEDCGVFALSDETGVMVEFRFVV
jgi:hypothetical protein